MTILELIQKRASVRNFTQKAVEPEKLEYIFECARLAPSAVNYQPWSCIVVNESDAIAKVRACYQRDWFDTAPLYLIICGNHETAWKRKPDGKDFCDIDTAIVVEHMVLAAEEQGLGSCWVCNFDAHLCRENFNIAPEWEPIALLPIGYPAEPATAPYPEKKRKPLSEFIKKNRFDK